VNTPGGRSRRRFKCCSDAKCSAARMHDKESEGVMMRWGLVPRRQGSGVRAGSASVRSAAIESPKIIEPCGCMGSGASSPLAGFLYLQSANRGGLPPAVLRAPRHRPVFGVAATVGSRRDRR